MIFSASKNLTSQSEPAVPELVCKALALAFPISKDVALSPEVNTDIWTYLLLILCFAQEWIKGLPNDTVRGFLVKFCLTQAWVLSITCTYVILSIGNTVCALLLGTHLQQFAEESHWMCACPHTKLSKADVRYLAALIWHFKCIWWNVGCSSAPSSTVCWLATGSANTGTCDVSCFAVSNCYDIMAARFNAFT